MGKSQELKVFDCCYELQSIKNELITTQKDEPVSA